jgi:hypothetical protein
MQPFTIGLSQWADSVVKEPASGPLYKCGPASGELAALIGDEERSSSLIAGAFWRSYVHSAAFARDMEANSLPGKLREEQPYSPVIVAHASGRYTLLFKHAGLFPGETRAFVAKPEPDDISSGYLACLEDLSGRALNPITDLDRLLRRCALEASNAEQFYLIVTAPYEEEMTAVFSPHAEISSLSARSTAGAVVQKNGRLGVTAAAHGVPIGNAVWVDGIPGTVLDRDDSYSDSCFIVPERSRLKMRSTLGPLSLAPRQHESVTFEGAQSGATRTRIVAWSYEIPYLDPILRPVVITEAVTAAGDSGAALIDADGALVGFSYSRSNLSQPVQYSTWIWAAAVFLRLGIAIYDEPDQKIARAGQM